MSLHPVVGGWPVVALAAVLLAALLVVSWRRSLGAGRDPGARIAWARRLALGLTVVLMLAGPSVAVRDTSPVSNVEIYLVVDRTGSMAAEDWAGGPDGGGGTRLDGVSQDLGAIRDAFPTARFSVLALDSTATRELPLTSDLDALTSWIDSLHQEVTDRSSGSSLERALPLLSQTLTASAENTPEDVRLVYILSDGEATDDGQGAAEASAQGLAWNQLADVVDGGAVLGYGSQEGGRMRYFSASGSSTSYIQDPTTGQDAVSVPDTAELGSVADAIGVPYLQRDGGTQDAPTSAFTDVDVNEVLSDGRRERSSYRYVTWPLGALAGGLLIWELAELALAERRARELTRTLREVAQDAGGRG